MNIPTLETERLIMRGAKSEDFETFADFCASDRSKYNGGPADRNDAWRGFAMMIGHWELRGYGMWWAEEKSTGAVAGRFGLWNPEGWLEAEVGWSVFDGFEGKGIAYEGSLAARAYAYEHMGFTTLTSVIAPENTRSIKLAERLGATFEKEWTSPSGKSALIYRHPSKETLQ